MKNKFHLILSCLSLRRPVVFELLGTMAYLLLVAAYAPNIRAMDATVESQSDTAYFFGNYGPTTYKSKLVASNDAGSAVTFGIGAHAGSKKQVGFEHRIETQATTFALTTSSIASVWTSTIIKYRIWWFELGAVVGNAKVVAKRESAEILNVTGSGYGSYGGLLIPLGKNNLLYLNGMSVATTKASDTEARVIALGKRTDIDIGARIGILRKGLDFTTGYRQRSNTITESASVHSELQTTTYVGMQAGIDF
jgi:hypothetical protein